MKSGGFSMVEVLAAMSLAVMMIAVTSRVTVGSQTTDLGTRQRTQAAMAAQTWIERYRIHQEPLGNEGTACSGTSNSFVCTYPPRFNFGGDNVYAHGRDEVALETQFATVGSVITGTRLKSGSNTALWELKVETLVQGAPSSTKTTLVGYVLQ